MSILSVQNLDVLFNTDDGIITAVENVSFEIKEGEVLGLVGESGSGKSVTAKSLMQLNPSNTNYGEKSSNVMYCLCRRGDKRTLSKSNKPTEF